MTTVIAKEEISYDNGDSNRRDNGDRSNDFVFALCTMFALLYISGFYSLYQRWFPAIFKH